MLHSARALARLSCAGCSSDHAATHFPQVANVDFSYFEESPMAARARLAGFSDGERDEELEFMETAALEEARLDELLGELLD